MKKTIEVGFRGIDTPTEAYSSVLSDLKEIYKEMGQGDNLLSHSPSRAVEYPWSIGQISGKRILDAGCGASPLLLYLKRKGYDDLTGIDSQSSFDNPTFSFKPEWERQYGITYEKSNILEYRSKVYDTVFCISVIEHIFRPVDRLKAIVNLWENVKDGGRLVVTLDYDDMLLLGFYFAVCKVGKLIDAFVYNKKVFGICIEKSENTEGLTEWLQMNEGK